MKIKTILTILTLALLLIACLPSRKVENFHIYETPPNGIKVSDNFFFDQTEVNNIGWLEYMFWVQNVFGGKSAEYTATFPDTLSWLGTACDTVPNTTLGFRSFTDSYIRHPAYWNYPAIGISQKQAEEFTKWRSDRVFEMLLIDKGIIQYHKTTRENYFTIEKYFRGEFEGIMPDSRVRYYPEFRLPTLNERQLILAYADSIDQIAFNKCSSKFRKSWGKYYKTYCDTLSCGDDGLKLRSILFYPFCGSRSFVRKKAIFSLRGNVDEWTAEANIAAGGGCLIGSEDTLNQYILQNDTLTDFGARKIPDKIYIYPKGETNIRTGFRNVCVWKKWED